MAPERESELAAPLLSAGNEGCDGATVAASSRRPRSTYLVAGVIFILTAGLGLPALPVLRIMEDTICRQHLQVPDGEPVNEGDCKTPDIQAALSMVAAVLFMLEAVPGLFLSLPYGILGDKIGRRPVLGLSIVGMTLGLAWILFVLWNSATFPDVRPVWASTAFHAVGGGLNVAIAMIYSMIADMEPSENLANSFFMNLVASLSAELLAVAAASRLMRISPWIPSLMGLALLIVCGILVVFLPETLKKRPAIVADEDPSSDTTSAELSFKSTLSKMVRELRDSTVVLKSYPIVALLLTMFLTGFVVRGLSFGAQYLSKTLDWPLAKAGMLMSFQVAMNIALYVAILPGASKLLTAPSMPFKLDPVVKDLWLARVSFVALVLGSLLIAVPSAVSIVAGLVIFTCGLGFSTLCRVVITSMIEPQQTGRLYTLIGVIDSASKLAAGPVVAWLFKIGMDKGEAWVGLPYLGISFLAAVAAMLTFSVRKDALSNHRHDSALRIARIEEDLS